MSEDRDELDTLFRVLDDGQPIACSFGMFGWPTVGAATGGAAVVFGVVTRFLVTGERARELSISERVRIWLGWAPAEVWGWFPGVKRRRQRRQERARLDLILRFGPRPSGGGYRLDESGWHPLQGNGPIVGAVGRGGGYFRGNEGPDTPGGGVREPRRPVPKPVSGGGTRDIDK